MKVNTRNNKTPVVMMRLLGELAAKPGTVDLLQASINTETITALTTTHLPSSCLTQAGLVVNRSYEMYRIHVTPSAV